MTWCFGLESKVIPTLDCPWSKLSKNVQDFKDKAKIGWVNARKPRISQIQDIHKNSSILELSWNQTEGKLQISIIPFPK